MRKNFANLFKIVLRRTIPLQLTTPITFCRFKHKSTLGSSYVLMEDGVEITELPWIVKRLEASEVFLKGKCLSEKSLTVINTEENCGKIGDESLKNQKKLQIDKVFVRMLQECMSADQVMKVLEIPGDSLTAHDAVLIFTLLHFSIQHDLIPALQPPVFFEIRNTITQQIKTLSNDHLLSLTKCCLSSRIFDKEFIEGVEEEIEGRVVLSYFTIKQLCSLITCLSEMTRSNPDLIKVLWIHLGNRFGDINENNISHVFTVLRNLPPESKYLIKVVDKQLQLCCSKLQADDIASISTDLCLLNYYSSDTFSLIGRWLYTNVHSLNNKKMIMVLGLFNHFNFSDKNFQKALEKFVVAFAKRTKRGGNKTTPRTLLRMTSDFCINRRYFNPSLFDALASDFAHPESFVYYDLRDGLTVLKMFGQLSYLPPNSYEFFRATELWIERHLNDISLPDLLELLASFVYIERYPVNFVDRALNTHTPAVLLELDDINQRNKASRHMLEIQASYLLEFPTRTFITLVDNNSLNLSLTWISGRAYKFQKEMSIAMRSLLGHLNFNQVHVPRNTPHLINFEFVVDQDKNILTNDAKAIDATKYAILLTMPEHLTSEGKLMGEHAMKKRHLEKLGFSVILISYEEMMWKCKNHNQRLDQLKSILKPFVNLQQ